MLPNFTTGASIRTFKAEWSAATATKAGRTRRLNCVNLLLTSADIIALEADILAGNLPPTSGFFFGASDGSKREDDLSFVAKAREALAAGLTVFYSSWW